MDRFHELRRQQVVEESTALVEKISGEPRIESDLLIMLAEANPEVLTGNKRTTGGAENVLRLVSNDYRKEAARLLGRDDLWQKPIDEAPTLRMVKPESSLVDQGRAVSDPSQMSAQELSLYWGPYFSDKAALKLMVDLFMKEKKQINDQNLGLNLMALYENEAFEKDSAEILIIGETEIREKFLDKLNRLRKGTRAKYEWAYSEKKVRSKHQNPLSFLLVRRVLGQKFKSATAENIIVPSAFHRGQLEEKILRDKKAALEEEPVLETKKMTHDAPKKIAAMFITLANQVAIMPENVAWLTGVEPRLFIPEALKPQLKRLKDLEVLCATANYHEHFESTVAALISYNFPRLVSSHSVKKARGLKKAEVEYYPDPASLTEVETAEGKTIDKIDKSILLQMNPKVAEHYGYKSGIDIYLSPTELESIWGMADDEIVYYQVAGKPVGITAKMFKRVFHKDKMPSSEELKDGEVVFFPLK